jgi:PPOX class probable F420-dependent enzyme
MDLSAALQFATPRKRGALTTIRADGRPQLSNIMFVPVDGALWISITTSRAKTKNLQRDPRCALYVPGDDVWSFVVLDGTAALTDEARDANDDVVEELVRYYRAGAGEHPDWDEYRAVMVKEGRLVAKFTATTAYGILPAS